MNSLINIKSIIIIYVIEMVTGRDSCTEKKKNKKKIMLCCIVIIEILQIEETSQPETCKLGWERVIWGIRLSLSNAVRIDKDRKNLPSSLSFALTEFADWRCHLQSGLWLVSSIFNISMIVIGACAVQFLHYVPLYRNAKHYATLNCSIKTRLCAGGTQIKFKILSSQKFLNF